MYNRVINFEDFVDGQQYLFNKNDFYTLQTWMYWMAVSHVHGSTSADKVAATNVLIHSDSTHGTNNRPVGYKNSTLSNGLLTLEDHVSNADIHSAPSGDSATISAGTLVARGWSEPIFVTAIVSNPLFEVMGHTINGPVFMPFPHHNMSPVMARSKNYINAMEPSASYPAAGIVDHIWRGSNYILEQGGGFYPFNRYDELAADHSDHYPASGITGAGYPYPSDAKDQTISPFLGEFSQFVYILPPYLNTPLNLNQKLDTVLGQSFNESEISIFTHQPLFVDSRHTKLLDRIRRSGISSDEILNFKDLTSIFMQDSDKPDLLKTAADHTCWLSRYKPIVCLDEKSNTGLGASMFFYDYEQEVNQFLSQVNYNLEGMETVGSVYFDYPFKTVTIDFEVFSHISSEDFYDQQRQKPFPQCLYDTDFVNYLSTAGGHPVDVMSPNERFSFKIFVDGLLEHKKWFKQDSGKDISEPITDYFDKLNVPYGFSNGSRQVLILKDPNIMRQQVLFKQNPFSNFRCMAYAIVEGYISVPFEVYKSDFKMTDELGGSGAMETIDTLEGKSDDEGWRVPPMSKEDENSGGAGDSSSPGFIPPFMGTIISNPLDPEPTAIDNGDPDTGGSGGSGGGVGGDGSGGPTDPCLNPQTIEEAVECCLLEFAESGIMFNGSVDCQVLIPGFSSTGSCSSCENAFIDLLKDCVAQKMGVAPTTSAIRAAVSSRGIKMLNCGGTTVITDPGPVVIGGTQTGGGTG